MEQTQDSLNTAPEKLVRGFTTSRFMFWIAVAVVIHVVFAGVTSVDYIRDTWIDPEGAAQRKAAADAAAANIEPEQPAASATPAAPPARAETGTVTTGSADATSEAALLEQRKDTPIVEAVTELPAEDEIPRHPDDLGISIGDTNE